MKSIRIIALALLVALAPFLASAHQSATYEIGDTEYKFVVGSQNEPIAVDDTTAVYLSVHVPGHEAMPATAHHAAGGAVTGLENTLQVELIAGDKKKTLDLAAIHGEPGAYQAKFYPTVATTIQYRFFGTINETPIDVTFTCRAEGGAAADEGEKNVSEGVKQITKTGGFGCPQDNAALGFPEQTASMARVASQGNSTRGMSQGALALAVVALTLASLAYRRKA